MFLLVPTTSTRTQRSSTMTTERVTMMTFTKSLPTTATTLYHRVLFANKPWIYISTRAPSTTVPPTSKYLPPSSQVPLTVTPTIPVPTPWYSPAGPFDWWQWQWYTTKSQKSTVKILSATQRSTRFSKATTTTTTTSSTTTTPLLLPLQRRRQQQQLEVLSVLLGQLLALLLELVRPPRQRLVLDQRR